MSPEAVAIVIVIASFLVLNGVFESERFERTLSRALLSHWVMETIAPAIVVLIYALILGAACAAALLVAALLR